MTSRPRAFWQVLLFVSLAGILAALLAADTPSSLSLDRTMKLYRDGNYKEAYDAAYRLIFSPDAPADGLPKAYRTALECLQQLNRVSQIDDFREQVATAHSENWQVLAAVAESYMNVAHYGFMIAGQFERGQHRGGGQVVSAMDRDRVRALQLYHQAVTLAGDEEKSAESAQLLRDMASALIYGRGQTEAWRLQYLTDLQELPDYEEGWRPRGGQTQGAPVDDQGNPIFYPLPEDWQAAQNDGQRWRWALETMARWRPELRNQERLIRAQFLHGQFGVQTMAQFRLLASAAAADDQDESGTWALHTLAENETMARLATGVKRFKLPDEHNFIKLYEQVAEDSNVDANSGDHRRDAFARLAEIFENRRQYPRAAECWQNAIELATGKVQEQYRQRLAQIVGNWGHFEPVMTQPAGRGATVEFRYRNGPKVEFVAREIRVKKLLDDVKEYLESSPRRLDWNRVNISNLGYRLVTEKQQEYVGAEVARWDLELDPREKHFDRRITVTTPLQKAGAYLVTAAMDDGNQSKIILWQADTAIVTKPLPDKTLYYVADAVTGDPVAKANVEFFGYRHQHVDANRFVTHTRRFAELTDNNGQAFLPHKNDEPRRRMNWLATATTPEGRFAYLGFQGVWHANYHNQPYRATKVYTITDRPVYRPKQKVQFKFWVRRAQFDRQDDSQFAYKSFQVEIRDPKNEKVFSETMAADEYGGIAGEYELPAEATLGQYHLIVVGHGGGHFRVEEYKKPEFEVTVEAPKEPVALGETVTATIEAKYYFGSPVTNAKVKYKVIRTEHGGDWFPPHPWDWLYGKGYWWLAYDYDWYPGWQQWGCWRPVPPWFWRSPTPPEVVAEREAEIGADGTLKLEIDTSLAKQIHPDQDHCYQIQAEVVDESRRTIVGTGRVLVARRPFKVFAWVDRGYYRVGDTVHARFAARRIDGKPVEGSGTLKLLKIRYADSDGRKPIETEVRSWDLPTDVQGRAELQIKASEAGQYRLSYSVTDDAEHSIEGGYVFTIAGEGFDDREFRFNDLELVPDRQQYAPGEKVRLQVNTNRVGSTVLLFVRPSNGSYLPPEVLRLEGKSTFVDIDVTKKDMPNFFVEAVTIAGGRLHTQVREIHVPPEKRILNVDVVPSAKAYEPGQEAEVKLKLTDAAGKPYVGSTVLAIYDKSVEYISGGSNVEDIKVFFWKWQRHHRPQSETNLQQWTRNLVPPGGEAMQNLGIFGGTVADELGAMGGEREAATAEHQFGDRVRSMDMRTTRLGAPAPPAPAAQQSSPMSLQVAESDATGADDQSGGELVQPTVRQEFADTALWIASLETDEDGLATTTLNMPENLTTWNVRVWAMGHGTRVGEGSAEVVTRKNLIVRMQAPRFFVERDEVVLSANVHNYLPEAKQVKVRLELDGKSLEAPGVMENTVEVKAGGEQRVDWRVKAIKEGTAVIRMLALTDQESDAVQMRFPVYVHGMLKMDSYSGVIRPEQQVGTFEIDVPSKRRAEQTRLDVRYSPTLAGAMVDALPYLIDYPYGCTEQTLNRFLPAVVTQQTLLRMGLDLKAIQEKRTNLNAQELGDDRERAKDWQRYDRNPVFDEAELSKIVKAGIGRLTQMQLSDGGWGWFTGWGEHSTPHTTAVVVHGLQIAEQNDVALTPGVLDRGVQWLKRYQQRQLTLIQNAGEDGDPIDESKPHKPHADNLDALVYMVLVDAGVDNHTMRDYLYRDRTHLAVYSLATYGLALHKQDQADKLAMVMRNIGQYVVQDDENQTAYLNLPAGLWWYWYGSEFEAHAYYLKLLAATEPKSELASRLVKYLLNNRKHATYWNSTRDTALVVEALADYLKASGEDKPDMTIEVWIDGQQRKQVAVNSDNLFTFDNSFVLTGADLEPGRHTVEIRKRGDGPLYYNGYLSNFTLEDDIRHAGLELKVNRRYYKLLPSDKSIKVAGSRGQAVDQRVEKYERQVIHNYGTVESGDLVEIELVVESKNDYEYIVLEDMKAAGFEPVDLRSGYTGNELHAYMEFRDNRVVMFVRRLARGTHSVTYRMRAEIPGRFSALPTKAHAMYAPELKGNSDEIKVRINSLE